MINYMLTIELFDYLLFTIVIGKYFRVNYLVPCVCSKSRRGFNRKSPEIGLAQSIEWYLQKALDTPAFVII